MIYFHAATLAQPSAEVLIDKPYPNIGLTDEGIGLRLLVNLHHVPVPERLGLVHLLPLEAAVPPEPRKLHPLRQVAVNLERKV
jgi:hypothetical protein